MAVILHLILNIEPLLLIEASIYPSIAFFFFAIV